jgi:cell division septal protein FtsQ
LAPGIVPENPNIVAANNERAIALVTNNQLRVFVPLSQRWRKIRWVIVVILLPL